MTYFTQSVIADDPYMRLRVAACAAQEGVTDVGIDPDLWTMQWRKVWASSPGWDLAWESALAGGMENPGHSDVVITDNQILAQVQLMQPFIEVSDNEPKMNPLQQASREFVLQVLEPLNKGMAELKRKVDPPEPDTLPHPNAPIGHLVQWLQVYGPERDYTALAGSTKEELWAKIEEISDAHDSAQRPE